jgi:hypothetical protein
VRLRVAVHLSRTVVGMRPSVELEAGVGWIWALLRWTGPWAGLLGRLLGILRMEGEMKRSCCRLLRVSRTEDRRKEIEKGVKVV